MKKFTVLLLSLFIGVFCYAQEITLIDKAGNNIEDKDIYESYQNVETNKSHYFYLNNNTDEDLILSVLTEIDEENSTITKGDYFVEEEVHYNSLSVCWGLCASPWMFGQLTHYVPAGGKEEFKFDFNNLTKEGVTTVNCKFINDDHPDVVLFEYTIKFIVTAEKVIVLNREREQINGEYTTNQEVGASVSHYFDTENITNDEFILTLSVEVDRENSTILEEDAELAICWGTCNLPWEFKNLTHQLLAGDIAELKFDFNNPTKEGVTILNCKYIDEATEAVVYEFTMKLTVGGQGIATPTLNYLKAYPNPATTNFYVNHDFSANVRNAQISLINILGVTVKEVQITNLSGTTDIDVSSLPAGIYFYSVKADGKTVETKKMIISR